VLVVLRHPECGPFVAILPELIAHESSSPIAIEA
jgi:hypothetical protein